MKNYNEFNFRFSDKLSNGSMLLKSCEFKVKDPLSEHLIGIYFKKLKTKDGEDDLILSATDIIYLDMPDINIPFPFKKRY